MTERPRYVPIVYVRGYAMTRSEIDQTAADPFCGFNLGSTVYRATPDRQRAPHKFVFESPVVRLATDFGYCDVFEDGFDIVDPGWSKAMQARSVVIYRYYDEASTLLGKGKTPRIETFARGLSDLILKVRDLVCANPESGLTPRTFECYLVAHSMGGLVCRAFLQNQRCGSDEARRCVSKLFTYATPHNGISIGGTNVPGWLDVKDLDTFSHPRMADYLDLKPLLRKTKRVDWMPEHRFPIERVFCLVGTNRDDYGAGLGVSRTFAGHGSDGLVRIENASVWGISREGKNPTPCATAYTYRAHSGPFGIVNSEEAYQNLVRFLFGDVRVDVWADVDAVTLPGELQKQERRVDALYQFECLASPRGKPWYLTRRVAEEDSVACRRHADLAQGPADARRVYLSTVFLANRARVDPGRKSLAYGLTFGVRVPDYEVDRKLWFRGHFEGRYLFRDRLTVEIEPPEEGAGRKAWRIGHWWDSDSLAATRRDLDPVAMKKGKVVLEVPFESKTAPGIAGKLRFVVEAWT